MQSEINQIIAAQTAAVEEVLKKLVSVTEINPDTVTAQNVGEVMETMNQRGYRFEQTSEGTKTTYTLYHHGKPIYAANVWTEFSEEDGQYKAVTKHQIVPVRGDNNN